MITREFTTPSGRFRVWTDDGVLECMEDGVWRSIPYPAQAEIHRLRALYEPDGRRQGRIEKAANARRLVEAGLTYREAAKAVGYKSASSVHRIVREAKGRPSP